jgi:hypothetical protein
MIIAGVTEMKEVLLLNCRTEEPNVYRQAMIVKLFVKPLFEVG